MRINPAVRDCPTAPIAEAWSWVADVPAAELIDVCQAEPAELPAQALRDHVAQTLAAGGAAKYTGIAGLGPLREALAEDIRSHYGGSVEASDVMITAGCNQAFCATIDALCAPGDEVILPLPFYFNHQMWLAIRGIHAKYARYDPQSAQPDVEDIRRLISARTRALVLVTPNNPTGAVYPPECIAELYRLAEASGIALIIDETYRDFMAVGQVPHALFGQSGWRDHFVHLYSFSKTYSLTGYRVGAVVAGDALREALIKVQDCAVICAPHAGQLAALYGLQHLQAWKRDNVASVVARATALRRAFSNPSLKFELLSAGAFFAYVQHPFEASARDAAQRLARAFGVISLPGSYFGPDQERYLRFAFANLAENRFGELVERLISSQS